MSTIKSYIYVKNHIPKELCEQLIDECNKKIWEKILKEKYSGQRLGLNKLI